MRQLRIEKLTLNIGTGKPGPELEKAKKLLQILGGAKAIETKTNKRIPGWSLRPGLSIGCKVTLRRQKAENLLRTLLKAKADTLDPRQIADEGNFAFGIKEYLDVPGIAYDIEIGVIGFEAAVTLMRAGFRIKHRRLRTNKIPARNKISREETMQFLQEKFGVKFVGV